MEAEKEYEQQLWELWLTNRDLLTRSNLFMLYSAWSRKLAMFFFSKYPHPLAEKGDYINLASLGLLQAIDRFNPNLNFKFQTFAEPYIKGNILKGLSCYIQDKPNHHAERVSISPESDIDDFNELIDSTIELAIGYFLEFGIISQATDNSPQKIYEQEFDTSILENYINKLEHREKSIIINHYYNYLSFVEIAELMGISKARVSQLHKQALNKIRIYYEQTEDINLDL